MASVNTGNDGGSSTEVDLNLAPILDCFVVLITFLLISASFLVLGSLDAGIAAAGKTSASDGKPPPIQIFIEIDRTRDVVVKLQGASNQSNRISAVTPANRSPAAATPPGTPEKTPEKTMNLEGLATRLTEIQKKWPGVTAVILSAHNSVEYRDVVQTMDAARKVMPVVLLGGF